MAKCGACGEEWVPSVVLRCANCESAMYENPPRHIMSQYCWCGPQVDSKDPITGVRVIVHHDKPRN